MSTYWDDLKPYETVCEVDGFRLLYQDRVWAICPPHAEPLDGESTLTLSGEEPAIEMLWRYVEEERSKHDV